MSEATRLLHLCEFAPREPGSFIYMVISVLAAARRRGWDAGAVFLENSRGSTWEQNFSDAGVPLEFAPVGGISELTSWLADRTADETPTVLHTHFHNFDIPTVRVARARRATTAVVWHVHSTMPTNPYWWARNVVKFGVWGRHVDAYLCPAQNIVDGVRSRLAPRDRVLFVPSAIDLGRFPLAGERERAEARAALDLAPDDAVLLHFGWHWHLKGGDIFCDTIETLVARGQTNLVALERGGDEIAHAEVARRGLGDVVRVLPILPSMLPLFNASDVLVSSSRSEGMAYTVLEALATGTAVVATDIPGHRFIADGADACRVVGTSPSQLADAVARTLARPAAEAAEERAQSRRWVEQNLSLEVVAERILDIYDRALASPANV
jgi:glycosyltransferase involved in cell wall biosynthesis